MRSILGALIAWSAFLGDATASTVVLTETDFDDTDVTVFTRYYGSGATASFGQQATGGNPGSYFETDMTLNQGSGGAGFVIVLLNDQTYDPSSQGAIASLDWQQDYQTVTAVATRLALFQDGRVFGFNFAGSVGSSWQQVSRSGLQSGTFFEFLPDGSPAGSFFDFTSSPDFSDLGAEIIFGFFNGNSTLGGGYSNRAGVDNWQVTINQAEAIPLPGAALLFLPGLAFLWRAARR